jgi:ribonuclease D
MTGTRNGIEDSQGCPPSASPVTPPEPASATPSETTAEAAADTTAETTAEAAAETHAVPLLEPRDGMPPLIVTRDALDDAIRWLAAGHGPVAVDAERASGFRYGHRAFLVQLRRRGAGTVLIDPVVCPDLSGLDDALAGVEAVIHAASQDLPCLADLGYRPQVLFDTELAGRLLGYPRVGLGTLVESVLGLTLEKSHSAADWSTRPLPEEWLRYAALDVEVLVELRDALAEQLADQGKADWARQEFATVLSAEPAPPRPDPWRRTSGIHRVRNRRGLAIVRELWLERDKIAQRRDLSPTRVLPDSAIVEAARSLPGESGDITSIAGFGGRGARRHAPEWQRAVQRARALPERALPAVSARPSDGPPPAHRWPERDPEAATRLTAVRTAVAALADEHHLPAENLLPPDAVRRLAWQPPDPPSPETVAAALAGYGARPWQVGLTSPPIAGALLRIAEKEAT